MTLSKKEIQRLTRFCGKAVDEWLQGSDGRRANLERWNDWIEGVVEDVDFPWEGASAVHVPLIAVHVITLHSIIARSLTTVDPLWYGKSLKKEVRAVIPEIEAALTYKAKSELNIIEALRDVIYTTARDGLGWLRLIWCEDKTAVETSIAVESVEDFIAEFPTPEDAGMDIGQYQETIAAIQAEATQDQPYNVYVKYNRVDYRGPKAQVVEEANMVRAPYNATEVRDLRAMGPRVYLRLEEIKARADAGELWPDVVKAYVAKAGTAGYSEDSWRSGRDSIEGIDGSDSKFSDEREIMELMCRYKFEGEDREGRVLCTYSHDKKMLLGAVKYPYTRDCDIAFRLMKRPGRLAGVSVPERIEGLNEEVDASLRYEINSSTIELAPIFIGKKSAQAGPNGFDPEAESNRIEPGTFWWLDDPKDVQQLKIMASDKSASSARRQECIRYMELLIGPTQLLSGNTLPSDPNMPGNKTISLIQQSNMRIEDYINEFRIGFDELGDTLLEMYHQFGGGVLEYEGKDGEVKELSRAQMRGLPKMHTHGVTANMNPEVEFAKALQWFQLLVNEPMVGGNPVRRRELISRLMETGRLPNREDLLPSKEEVAAPPPPPQKPPPEPPKVSVSFKADLPPAIALQFAETGNVAPPPPPPPPMPPVGAGGPQPSGSGGPIAPMPGGVPPGLLPPPNLPPVSPGA